ncbi:MAG: hypothetical protein HRT89_16575 [Lentisphaeria bacterium]|nr:hypothetical protein [Lentisphaeria bacterium]
MNRTPDDMTPAEVDSYVDNYAQGNVKEVFWCVNARKAAFDSSVIEPTWAGYGETDEEIMEALACVGDKKREAIFNKIRCARKLSRNGIDVFERWLHISRQKGLGARLSIRMNDAHFTYLDEGAVHSTLWLKKPELRRTDYLRESQNWRTFDYAQEEIQNYFLAFIDEVLGRYDLDTLELDWMRHNLHFRPGFEEEGIDISSCFMEKAHELVIKHQKKRDHKIELAVRVPTHYEACLGLGLDPILWARKQYVDRISLTPLFQSCDSDIPIRVWKTLLSGSDVMLAGCLEANLMPYPGAERYPNALASVLGQAASLAHKGADKLYLFNFFPEYPKHSMIQKDPTEFPHILNLTGTDEPITEPRRHIVTYADTVAYGEKHYSVLPLHLDKKIIGKIRIHVGTVEPNANARVILGFKNASECDDLEWVRVNGRISKEVADAKPLAPGPTEHLLTLSVEQSALHDGYNVIEVSSKKCATITWAEMSFS